MTVRLCKMVVNYALPRFFIIIYTYFYSKNTVLHFYSNITGNYIKIRFLLFVLVLSFNFINYNWATSRQASIMLCCAF